MLSTGSTAEEVTVRFPEGQNKHMFVTSDIVNYLLKTNDWRGKRSNFASFVVCSLSLAMFPLNP